MKLANFVDGLRSAVDKSLSETLPHPMHIVFGFCRCSNVNNLLLPSFFLAVIFAEFILCNN